MRAINVAQTSNTETLAQVVENGWSTLHAIGFRRVFWPVDVEPIKVSVGQSPFRNHGNNSFS
jgi:hypothetical protein